MQRIESKRLTEGYREWIEAMNYSKNSIVSSAGMIGEFLEWVKSNETIKELSGITDRDIQDYYRYLSRRKNKRRGGVLSMNTIRGHVREIRRFSRYLLETGQGHIGASIKINAAQITQIKREIFSSSEVKRLYKACEDDLLGIRDRAMLSVYYGCGLRRNEGVNLKVKDVQFTRGMLHVRKAKNYKERYVPMVDRVAGDIENYLENSRPVLATVQTGEQLFVSYRGKTVGGQSMHMRFKKLKKAAGIEKPGSLHALRHSIATHLLAGGMSLEQIGRFLGHSSLESTQIYTHIVHETI